MRSLTRLLLVASVTLVACHADQGSDRNQSSVGSGSASPADDAFFGPAQEMLAEGRQTFRFDTFGDEQFWGGTRRLHEAVAKLTPRQALALGVDVDLEALPAQLQAGPIASTSARSSPPRRICRRRRRCCT